MRKQESTGWGAWLLGLLVLTPIMTLFDLRPNNVQTELAVGRPPLTPSRVFDADYYSEIDDWMTHTAATRGAGLLLRVKLDYEILGDSTTEQVVVGSGGWLFSRELIDHDCAAIDAIGPPPIPAGDEDIVTYLVSLPKSHFLANRLPSHDRATECVQDARADLRVRLAEDPSVLDVNALFDERPAGMFLKGDPGWSPDGRLAVAEALIDRIAPGLWDASAVAPITEVEDRLLYRLLGYATSRRIEAWEVDREVEFRISGRRTGHGLLTWQRSSVEGEEVVPGTTYLFGGARLASVVPLVQQYFEELVFIGWDGTDAAPVDLTDVPPPDRVVVEALESTAVDRFANPVLADVFTRMPDRDPPTAATDLQVEVVTPTKTQLNWTAATDETGIFNYLIARDGAGVGIVEAPATTFTDITAVPDATHEYTVIATDAAGNSAPASETVTITMPPPDVTPPVPATAVTAVATSPTSVALTWVAATDEAGLFNYLVVRDGFGTAALEPTETTYTDTLLSPDTVYSYTILATDISGNTTASEAVLVTTPPPDTEAPTAPVVTAVATSPTTIEITWTAAQDASAIFNYLVARDGAGVAVVEGGVTSFTDEVEPESVHAYTVVATDAAGNSTTSEAVLVATPAAG